MIIDDDVCFECGAPATEQHHVIPQSLGGKMTIPICGCCHALVHGGYNKRRDDHVELTVAGLERAKERGVLLGNRTNLAEARKSASNAVKTDADTFALSVKGIFEPLVALGLTYREVATLLSEQGVKTRRGGMWTPASICRIFKRLKQLDEDICKSSHPPIDI